MPNQSNDLLMTGTYGAYQTAPDSRGQHINVRIIDAVDIGQKLALVTLSLESGPEARVDVIEPTLWKKIQSEGLRLARLANVDIARQPFNQYIAQAYCDIIK